MSGQGLTDEQLIEQVKEGSKEAFSELYNRYKSIMYNYLYHYLGNKQKAEDCLQDLFIHLFDRAGQYNPSAKFSSWFYTMAKHLALDALRKDKVRQAGSLDQELELEEGGVSLHDKLQSADFDPRQAAESSENIEILKRAMALLNETDREVIVLCDIQEMPYREVAEILKCPEKTVAVKLFRARQRLSKILEGKGSE